MLTNIGLLLTVDKESADVDGTFFYGLSKGKGFTNGE